MTGPCWPGPSKACAVLALKTGYVRETNGRYYVTSRLDCFLMIEPAGAELLTKTVSPLLGQTADSNFLLTAGFVASLFAHRGTEHPQSPVPCRQAGPRAAGSPLGVLGVGGQTRPKSRPGRPPREQAATLSKPADYFFSLPFGSLPFGSLLASLAFVPSDPSVLPAFSAAAAFL